VSHVTETFRVKRFGQTRWQARCKSCRWRGEFRRDDDEAEMDGMIHEGGVTIEQEPTGERHEVTTEQGETSEVEG
jgi:hypothetical protein